MVSCILFRSLNHFHFIFVYCIRECSDFTDLHVAIHISRASLVAQLVKTACNAGDLCSIPGLGRSPGQGNGYPLQYSGLENSVDRGA